MDNSNENKKDFTQWLTDDALLTTKYVLSELKLTNANTEIDKLRKSNEVLLSALKCAKDIMTTYGLMKSKAGYEVNEAIKLAEQQ